MSGTNSTTYSYYQAICKKASATTCTCEGGQPAFGAACKKTGVAACSACQKGYKLNAKKTACTPQFQSKKGTYIVSYKGTCPKGYSFVDTNFNECKEAFKVLKNGKSLTTRVYKTTSRGYPKGCSFYANYNRGYFSGEQARAARTTTTKATATTRPSAARTPKRMLTCARATTVKRPTARPAKSTAPRSAPNAIFITS